MNNQLNTNINLSNFFIITIVHIFVALILGVIIETIAENLQFKLNLSPIIVLIIQLILSLIILYMVESRLIPIIGLNWAFYTPALFFGTLFFLVQDSIFKNFIKVSHSYGLLIWT